MVNAMGLLGYRSIMTSTCVAVSQTAAQTFPGQCIDVLEAAAKGRTARKVSDGTPRTTYQPLREEIWYAQETARRRLSVRLLVGRTKCLVRGGTHGTFEISHFLPETGTSRRRTKHKACSCASS
jgi:hypothetical protein